MNGSLDLPIASIGTKWLPGVHNLNSFFKSSLTGKDQDVLENMSIDYFGDEGTVEREFNCLITFINK